MNAIVGLRKLTALGCKQHTCQPAAAGLQAQEELLEAAWSLEEMSLPGALLTRSEEGAVLWRGPRVRCSEPWAHVWA